MAYIFGSIWDRFNRNALNDLSKSVELQGKSIQDLVAEGQLTPTQYAALIQSVNGLISKGNVTFDDIDINKGKLLPKHASEELLSMIAGNAPINAVPADGSITSSKLSEKAVNIEKISDSVNSLLQARVIPNNELNFKLGSISGSGGDAVSSTRVRSDFFNVTGKTVISNRKNGDIKISAYLYDENKILISSIPFTFSDLHFEHNGEVRFIVAYSDDREITNIKNLADLVDVYTTGKSIKKEHLADGIMEDIIIKENSINKEKTDFIRTGTNIFNKEKITLNKGIVHATGIIYDDDRYLITEIMRANAKEVYTVINFNRVAFYDENDNHILTEELLNSGSTYTTPDNTAYQRLHGLQRLYDPNVNRINKGSELLPFENYQIYIDGHPIIKDSEGKTESAVIYPPEEIGKNALLQNKEFQYPTVPELYQMYDDLIAEFPKILSKKIFGKDTTGEFDIWELHLKPEEYDKSIVGFGAKGTLAGKKPKITFIAGIHGHEQSSVVGTYYFIEALLKQWKNDDVLDYLRHNVEFKFIPLVYPNGYITDMYSNITGINLQTNFPYNFTPRDPDRNVYGGEEPLTEIEVHYVKNLIDENPDSVLFVDLHSPGYTADFAPGIDSLFYYIIARDEQYRESIDTITKHGIESITRLLKKNYPIDNDNLLGWVTYRDGNGTADAYAESLDIPSMVFEIPSQTPYNLTKLNSDSIKMAAEVIANTFAISLNYFKENQ